MEGWAGEAASAVRQATGLRENWEGHQESCLASFIPNHETNTLLDAGLRMGLHRANIREEAIHEPEFVSSFI